ncbi:hypothetical protein FALCPG4_014218 [Fusarium falciforme]
MLALLVRTKLTQNLTRVMPQLKQELEYILATEFPSCEDWTPVKWQPFGLRAVARMSGRAFVGPSISRDEKWMNTTINFAIHVFTACVKLQLFPEWARPIGQHFVSELGQIRNDIKTAKEMLLPILEERLRDMDMPGCEDAPDDMIQWLIEGLPEEEKADVTVQAELQLILAAASIHSTNNLLCECLCDLAAYPEVQEELREEAYRILEVEKGWEKKGEHGQAEEDGQFHEGSSAPSWKHHILHPKSHETDLTLRRHPASPLEPRCSLPKLASPSMRDISPTPNVSMPCVFTIFARSRMRPVTDGNSHPSTTQTSILAQESMLVLGASLLAMRSSLCWHIC